jgi:hypothetical protein
MEGWKIGRLEHWGDAFFATDVDGSGSILPSRFSEPTGERLAASQRSLRVSLAFFPSFHPSNLPSLPSSLLKHFSDLWQYPRDVFSFGVFAFLFSRRSP